MLHPFVGCFNTSYVSVQVTKKGKNNGNNEVSIHHMCRFKFLLDSIFITLSSFNTSYVSVQANNN